MAKVKYIKGCHILEEMTMQLNHYDWKPGKNVIINYFGLFLSIRKGCNFALGIWKGYHIGKNEYIKG